MTKFYKNFFLLMIPMALKELIASLVNLVDTVMVGQLGESAIAAVGIGNQVYFLYTVFLFGICCGASVFSSQFWGLGDVKQMRKILGLSLRLSVILSAIFVFAALVFPKQIFLAFRADAATMEVGITYLRIVSIGYLFTAITTAFDFSVCSSENAGLPFLVRVIGLIVNVFLNWILIFGHLGVPALGVTGAAIATVIARVTEFVVMLSVVYGKKMIQAAKWKELSSIPKDLVIRFFKTSSPVIFNEMMWSLGIFLYSWVFAQISVEAMVIITIVQNIERLLLVFFHGSGNAGGVLIGKAVGAGHFEDAYLYTKRLIGLLSITSVILSVVFVFARPLILMPYDISPEVYKQCMDLLIVIIVMMTIKSLTFLLIVGAFRNGGDTKTAMKIDVCCVWLVGLPMVLLGAFVFKFPLLICYAMICMEEVVKIVVCMRHFSTKKWIKNVVS